MLPASATALQNTSAKSTPLHWATVNKHLEVAKRVVEVSGVFIFTELRPDLLFILILILGLEVLDIKNSNGRSVITEAEMTGWEEGVNWMMSVMSVDVKEQEGDEVLEDVPTEVEVEIEDAEGRIAKINIGAGGAGEVREVKGGS